MTQSRFNGSTDANAGYTPDGNVTAITLLHESGTGGAPKYGIIPQMPLTTLEGINVLDNLTYMQPRIGNDSASIGYYKTDLQNGVTVELGASMHAGLIHYTFPSSGDRYILVDLSHYLPTQDEAAGEQFYSNAHIDISDDGSQYSGYGVYRGGWNEGKLTTGSNCSYTDRSKVLTILSTSVRHLILHLVPPRPSLGPTQIHTGQTIPKQLRHFLLPSQ